MVIKESKEFNKIHDMRLFLDEKTNEIKIFIVKLKNESTQNDYVDAIEITPENSNELLKQNPFLSIAYAMLCVSRCVDNTYGIETVKSMKDKIFLNTTLESKQIIDIDESKCIAGKRQSGKTTELMRLFLEDMINECKFEEIKSYYLCINRQSMCYVNSFMSNELNILLLSNRITKKKFTKVMSLIPNRVCLISNGTLTGLGKCNVYIDNSEELLTRCNISKRTYEKLSKSDAVIDVVYDFANNTINNPDIKIKYFTVLI